MRYFLELCLKSVEAAITDLDAEIIVVDNNSPDDSCQMVKQLFPAVKLIENKENSGFSKGNNIGVAQAKGEYLCILNPDTVVSEDTFTKLIAFADSKKNLGIVGCQLIDGRGQFLPESKRNVPTPIVSLKKVLGNSKDYYANHVEVENTGKVDILVGAFMWLKKEVYESVGGFDEEYFMYGEDIDLSYKVIKAGYDNYYFGDTTVIHFKGESTLRDANYARRFYGAMQIFYKKHFKRNVLLNGMVWLGIKMAYLMRKNPDEVNLQSNQSYLYATNYDKSVIEKLPNPVHIETIIQDKVENNSMIIYDLKALAASAMISDMKIKSKQENIVFRFIPKNSNFSLGSDSATSRGEVLHF